MPHTSSHDLQPSAGDQEWQALRLIIYPWPGGVYVALERRDGRGGSHRDTRLIAGPVQLEHELDANADLPALLRTVGRVLSETADRTGGKHRASAGPAA